MFLQCFFLCSCSNKYILCDLVYNGGLISSWVLHGPSPSWRRVAVYCQGRWVNPPPCEMYCSPPESVEQRLLWLTFPPHNGLSLILFIWDMSLSPESIWCTIADNESCTKWHVPHTSDEQKHQRIDLNAWLKRICSENVHFGRCLAVCLMCV